MMITVIDSPCGYGIMEWLESEVDFSGILR